MNSFISSLNGGAHLAQSDELLEQQVGGDGLSGAGLAADDDALGLLLVQHSVVGRVGHGEDVRRVVGARLAAVQVHLLTSTKRSVTATQPMQSQEKRPPCPSRCPGRRTD
jgi:hypothetical protein